MSLSDMGISCSRLCLVYCDLNQFLRNMDLRKPKGGSSKLKEMQDQLKEKNLKTLGKIADK